MMEVIVGWRLATKESDGSRKLSTITDRVFLRDSITVQIQGIV